MASRDALDGSGTGVTRERCSAHNALPKAGTLVGIAPGNVLPFCRKTVLCNA